METDEVCDRPLETFGLHTSMLEFYRKVKSRRAAKTQLFPARNFYGGGGVQRGLSPRRYIRQPPLGVLWLLSVATESNNLASADATGAAEESSVILPETV